MHPSTTVHTAFRLAQDGLPQSEIAGHLDISVSTVGRWLRAGLDATLSAPMGPRFTPNCPEECLLVHSAPEASYAYLLGQYLGDGSIVQAKPGVFRLTVTCCAAYPAIAAECTAAMSAVFPYNAIGRRARTGAVDISCYSKHLPCMFPQHGPGRKHERDIRLAPWQSRIAFGAHADQFIRGLVHSDGCRSINRVRGPSGKEYAYVRYTFSNRSEDIRDLFCCACDELGIPWRQMNRFNISVARRSGVARLDAIVGEKC